MDPSKPTAARRRRRRCRKRRELAIRYAQAVDFLVDIFEDRYFSVFIRFCARPVCSPSLVAVPPADRPWGGRRRPMRACCLRVSVAGQPWDCLFVVERGRGRGRCTLYASVHRLPCRASARRLLLLLTEAARPREPTTAVDANRFERAIKALECSDALRRAVVRDANDNGGGGGQIAVRDIGLLAPAKYRLAYTWCEIYEKTDIEYRELENIMAWLSTLGGAFSSLGDQTEYCAIKAGEISLQQLRIAMRIGDPLTAARCKLYAAISLMQRGYFKQAKFIVQSQYVFIKSQLNVDDRLIKMCCGIWTKLRYEWNRGKKNAQNELKFVGGRGNTIRQSRVQN